MGKTEISLDSAPDHSIALGRMLGHWAVVESMLSDVLGDLLGIEQSRQHMLFNTFISIQSKIELIQRLIYSYVIDSPEKEQLLELIQKAIRYNSIRNSFVHSAWGWVDPKRTDTLMKIDRRVPNNEKSRIRPYEQITASTIDAFVSELSELSSAFVKFQVDGFPKIQISVQPLQ